MNIAEAKAAFRAPNPADYPELAGVRIGELGDGFEHGVCVADFRAGSGLAFTRAP